jgi:hypothetical protein
LHQFSIRFAIFFLVLYEEPPALLASTNYALCRHGTTDSSASLDPRQLRSWVSSYSVSTTIRHTPNQKFKLRRQHQESHTQRTSTVQEIPRPERGRTTRVHPSSTSRMASSSLGNYERQNMGSPATYSCTKASPIVVHWNLQLDGSPVTVRYSSSTTNYRSL